MHHDKCIMDTCIMDTCIIDIEVDREVLDNLALVTWPQCHRHEGQSQASSKGTNSCKLEVGAPYLMFCRYSLPLKGSGNKRLRQTSTFARTSSNLWLLTLASTLGTLVMMNDYDYGHISVWWKQLEVRTQPEMQHYCKLTELDKRILGVMTKDAHFNFSLQLI